MLKASKGSVMIIVFILFEVCSGLAYLVCVHCNKENQPQHHIFPLFFSVTPIGVNSKRY